MHVLVEYRYATERTTRPLRQIRFELRVECLDEWPGQWNLKCRTSYRPLPFKVQNCDGTLAQPHHTFNEFYSPWSEITATSRNDTTYCQTEYIDSISQMSYGAFANFVCMDSSAASSCKTEDESLAMVEFEHLHL